jgi:hypothetical protein
LKHRRTEEWVQMGEELVTPGVLGQAALALADGFARVLLAKGVIDQAEYVRGFDLAISEWEAARGHPQQDEVLRALRKIHPGSGVSGG